MEKINLKLHLGSGSVYLPGWINIDLNSNIADLNLDLTQPLPFESGSVTHIFNEHFIEHVTREQAVNLLKECHRLLSSDGVIRITTPNLLFIVKIYLSKKLDEWGDLWKPDTPCQLMNESMHSWGHKFIYDADELTSILIESGFNTIEFKKYRQSTHKQLENLESRPFHNELIIEARKSKNIELITNPSEHIHLDPYLINIQPPSDLEQELAKKNAHLRKQKKELDKLENKINELTSLYKESELISNNHKETISKLNSQKNEIEEILKKYESSWTLKIKKYLTKNIKDR